MHLAFVTAAQGWGRTEQPRCLCALAATLMLRPTAQGDAGTGMALGGPTAPASQLLKAPARDHNS